MRVVTNVPNVWWHYVLTLVLGFIISTKIVLLSINLGRDKIVINDYVAIYMHGVIYIQLAEILGFKNT